MLNNIPLPHTMSCLSDDFFKKIIKKCYNDDYLVTLYAEGDM